MSGLSELEALSDLLRGLLLLRVALGANVLQNLPSWTWARFNDPIEFLFSIRGLNANGKPMAQCLEFTAPSKENAYFGDPLGHVVLKGALQAVVVRPCEIGNVAHSVAAGRWTAQLLRVSRESGELTRPVIGYAALDEDPRESNIAGKSMRVLLMRDDSVAPCMENRVTPSGYLRPGSVGPLSFAVNGSGLITGVGGAGREREREEWLACLLLQETQWSKDVYRRVGLCQVYRGVWEEELVDVGRRQESVVLI